MSAQHVVKECEKVFKKNNMAGIIIALTGEDDGYYKLSLPKESVFQELTDDNCDDRITDEDLDAELKTLSLLAEMIAYCSKHLKTLASMLHEATDKITTRTLTIKDKRDVN